mmetsp:Transcript_75173/g.147178  ORF Transcript_75173/g.147178 Transcript_75173/m.147178 type:complete len:524 (-) Transcript_75173:103-1674(-)
MAEAVGTVTHTSFVGHKDSVNCIEWSRSLNLLASSSDDGTVRLWDLRAGKSAVRCLSAFHKAPVQLVTWAPPQSPALPNALWAAAGRDVFCFDLRKAEAGGLLVREATASLRGVCAPGDDGDDEITSLDVQPRGGSLVTAADDSGAIHVLELCPPQSPLADSPSSSNSLVGSPSSSTAAEALPPPSSASLSSPAVTIQRRGSLVGGHGSVVTGALFHPTMQAPGCVVSGALDASLALWDLAKLPTLPSDGKAGSSGSSGGVKASRAACLAWSETVGQAPESMSSAQSFNPPLVHAIAVHPNGKYFACGLGDASVALHAFASPSSKAKQKKKGGGGGGSGGGSGPGPLLVRRLVGGHSCAVAAVHFSAHDDDLLLSAGNDKRISFWHLAPLLAEKEADGASKGAAAGTVSDKSVHTEAKKGSSKKNKHKKRGPKSKEAVEESRGVVSAIPEDERASGVAAEDAPSREAPPTHHAGSGEDETEGSPHARLVHGEKVNWMASAHHTSAVFLADVTSVISIFDVSRV